MDVPWGVSWRGCRRSEICPGFGGHAIGAGRGFAVDRLRGTNGFKGSKDGRGVGAFRTAIEARTGTAARVLTPVGAYDGRYFSDDGIEIINVGPGSGTEGHATNESVSVMQLVDAAIIHRDVVERLLGLND